ncbi:hypothetical protein FFWV33_13710 [Flavobacterium faecale]|uniref:DUF3307 domain-containing protein n=1 Tax=Flavobacterium faecale TaxID=1355330 RepID=A0A2S1LG39_9FLAO|nr:DUF3307 domain-containing protein [Flavobacterium faecale]AWG22506.1 hypothetical protein FFWV33_13710 [Flavobacterium faecale]
MLDLLLPLLLAHLIGDFLLQPDHWVKAKSIAHKRVKYLSYHVGVHAILLLVALQFQLHYWMGILCILISHFVIDWIKIKFQNKKNQIWIFFADQLAHLVVLFLIALCYVPFEWDLRAIANPKTALFCIAFLLQTQVSAIVMRVLLSKWKMKDDNPNQAGKYIGMLERLFIFGFVVMNFWEGIGFLLAAKSIFRFGDLNNAKDRTLTEYVLIGTLLSFGLAMLIAKGYLVLLLQMV